MRLLTGVLFSCLLILPPAALTAQMRPASTGGLPVVDQQLRMLGSVRRVLVIGAHPDDEDTDLLTLLVRGQGAEAAYLALDRGEGGQNLIGPELGVALGLLRTEELLAARRLDGAGQFFTRAYDFGFSKTQAETWTHWVKDSVLKDVVRIIRRYQPQVMVSIFSGTPRDGHGQHQAAGWVTHEAFRLAGDSSAFPELQREEGLAPWTVAKLYRASDYDTTGTTLVLNAGALDPVVGQSYHQIAMRGRSQHRSQDMGQLQRMGPAAARLQLLRDRTGHGAGGVFAGVDTSLAGNSLFTRPLQAGPHLQRFQALLDSARALTTPLGLDRVPPLLMAAERELQLASGAPDQALTPVSAAGRDLLAHLRAAYVAARGMVLDPVTDDDRLTPGQALPVTLAVWNTSARPATVRVDLQPGLAGNPATSLSGHTGCFPVPPGDLVRRMVKLTVPTDQPLSNPYFLDRPMQGDMYGPAPPALSGLPRNPPLVVAQLRSCDPDQDLMQETREVSDRIVDQAQGEIRRPLAVVPRVGVEITPGTDLWRVQGRPQHQFTVTIIHGAPDTTRGTVGLEVPRGWSVSSPQPFVLDAQEERAAFGFTVRPPAGAGGAFSIRAVAHDDQGRDYSTGSFTVDYPHIRPVVYTRPADARVEIAPLTLPALARVGYVRGAADRVPEALASVGVPIELLGSKELEDGDLSRYDAIVIGSRAYETDSALVENNRRLLEYVRNGGLLIVQYQQYQFIRGAFAPYPLTIARPHDRVTDENAPVTPVSPDEAVLSTPNRITDADWQGWVQERGLYFAHTWDPAYAPQLSLHDPGEPPLEGGLLIAHPGRGTYVYTGLAFFRQLPAAVPGAYRLFANLLALGQRPRP